MNEMLAYSIHLGNDKNKTKKAKEIAKNNQSNKLLLVIILFKIWHNYQKQITII